uniref:ATP synthase subunit a n=1 Tax=Opiliones sp. MT-2014 TaxID=1560019 RepID=A0A0A0S179_9ARAC|nr:ATP synthase F0 subunit 6 [Opiliones sp. MT-2014]
MMTNLFSSFDPSTSQNLAFNWISAMIPILLTPLTYWVIPNRSSLTIKTLLTYLNNELKSLLNPSNTPGLTIFIIAIMWMIMINNLGGLIPFVFTATSHMVISISLALPLWLTFMIFGWLNNTNKMFAHLLPNNTPIALMSFMILIETVSNLIRPLTLSIRLSANMIAGHLLLTLLGNQGTILSLTTTSMVIMVQLTLLTLELAVAMIQAYVFIVLISLYSTEVH